MSVFDNSRGGAGGPIWGDNFRQLRRSLGLGDTPNRIDLGLSGSERDDYDQNNDLWGGLVRDYGSRAAGNAGLERMMNTRSQDLLSRYTSASVHDPFLDRVGFLEGFDPEKYRKTLSWMERGERPWVYTRGFRTLGG